MTAFRHDLSRKPRSTHLPTSRTVTSSTSLPGRLIRHTFRPHLALNPPRLPPRCSSRTLRLLSLLLALSCCLLLLALRDCLLTCCLAGLGTLRAAVFDEFEGSADDASLLLYGAAGALFGGFLQDGREVSGLSRGASELGV